MKKLLTAASLVFAVPFIALAQTTAAGSTLTSIVTGIKDIVDSLIPIMIGAALVVFFWGLVRYILKQGAGKATNAKNLMIWSLIALFVMVSVWGIIRVAQSTLGISSTDTTITAPTVGD